MPPIPDPLAGLRGADISRFLGWVVCVPLPELGRTDPERAERLANAIRRWGKGLSAEAKAYVGPLREEWMRSLA